MNKVVIGLLWLGVALVSAATSRPAPRLEVTFPTQHSWWQVSNDDGLLADLPVYFQTHNFKIPRDGFLFVTGDSVPEEGYRQTAAVNSVVLGGIDPGTHFWKLELRSWSDSSVAVAEATLHVEVVVNPSDERSPWKYTLQEQERRPLVFVNAKSQQDSIAEVLPVCYVSSTSGAFDGQRRMWLQIMEGLRGEKNNNTVEFQFEVKTFEQVVTNAPLTRALQRLNVSLQGLPLEIFLNELSDEDTSPDGVINALLASFYRRFPWAKHDSRQISKLDQPDLRRLDPPYAARVWTDLVNALSSPCADGLIIFSNSRRISDKLLVLAARLAGPRAIVMELANLHPTKVDVDFLLAPSHFARDHYSISRNIRAHHKVVLATGVNTRQFTPATAPPSDEQTFVIGYVGRLAPEKSLGILLAAMKILGPVCSRCRLRIVGDGPQKLQLQSIASEWGLLGTSVEFVGGIYYDEQALVSQLREMHVFASPMFTETLGLAVLEAMSVGLPVVGFISGGTGEFLEDGVNCRAVTKATAAAFADALLTLAHDSEMRIHLGRQARHTVVERFSTHKALEQYSKLYDRAGRPLPKRVSTQESHTQDECKTCTGEFCGLDTKIIA